MSHSPTPEQQIAIDMFSKGDSIAVEAGAGTGKTSTLVSMAEGTNEIGRYLAFNKSIVEESKTKLPRNVEARTAHSLAFQAIGRKYRSRLNSSGRMRSDQIARVMGLDPFNIRKPDGGTKVMQPGYLGSLAMRALSTFCNSADKVPSKRHIPYIDGIDPIVDGRRTFANNDRVAHHVADVLPGAWSDLVSRDGRLPFKHDHYLKMYELGSPRMECDFVMTDEAQDLSPVMASIVAQQVHAQRIFVGDSQQSIYGWRGAVNAMEAVAADKRAFLTQSFRFGPAVAGVANLILDELNAELRLTGLASIPSTVGLITDLGAEPSDAILCRSNARAVATVLEYQRRGFQPYLMGGGGEVARFAEAAAQLMAGERTRHPELACFDSWTEVLDYVAFDPSGDELGLNVRLVEDYGTQPIIDALGQRNMPASEANADLVVSTAHKSKGREWDRVQIAGDFQTREGEDIAPEEWRLMYVACTRAKMVLDVADAAPIRDLVAAAAKAAKSRKSQLPSEVQ